MDEFVKLVSDMRRYQKEYFKTKDANAYVEAKRLEREVDNAIAELEQKKMGETLF